ncbi:MAG: DUF3787 domain-containing protein [Clostridiales bacterium]|nr:DUF3787 domain-containing protein [Clostridiales bacterium]
MDNKTKQKDMAKPIESHETAAWANIESLYPESKVSKPSDMQVENAKDFVDTNEK